MAFHWPGRVVPEHGATIFLPLGFGYRRSILNTKGYRGTIASCLQIIVGRYVVMLLQPRAADSNLKLNECVSFHA